MSADVIQKIVVSVIAANVGDSTVAVDVPQDGWLESMYWNFHGSGMDALNDAYTVELSFASSNTLNNNDARISIWEITEIQQFLTTGGGANGLVGFMQPEIPLFAGERLHVHTAVVGGTVSINGSIYLYHRTRGSAPPRRSQRRR